VSGDPDDGATDDETGFGITSFSLLGEVDAAVTVAPARPARALIVTTPGASGRNVDPDRRRSCGGRPGVERVEV
jgi:hypothetical protein